MDNSLIKRQDAIDEVVTWLKDRMTDKKNGKPLTDRLKDLPPAQSEQQWIPCSERLPEESDGTVLVCFPDEFPYSNKEPYINAKHNQRVKTASYSQFNKTWYIGDFGAIGEVRPIAWMPLPEPWKGEQDGDIREKNADSH